MRSLKNELEKFMLLDVTEAVEIAISTLTPIEFEVAELSGSIFPVIGRIDEKTGEYLYFRIRHGCGQPEIVAETNSHFYDYRHNFRNLIVPVQCLSQKEVNEAIQSLWESEKQNFFALTRVVKLKAWADGNDLYKDIKKLENEREREVIVDWEVFCLFSQTFTNGANPADFEKNLVYMDNSGGFKCRGAFESRPEFATYNSKEIIFYLIPATPLAGKSIEHHFGDWQAYEYKERQVFFFGSCNGNYLSATTIGQGRVKVLIGRSDSNYGRFFANYG